MTTLSTHDTKRGEDVRARITALAEMPTIWGDALDRLLELAPAPDPGFASLLWQAVLGAWPASRERLHAYADVDEANAHLGVAIATGGLDDDVVKVLTHVQNDLFDVGADFCTPVVPDPEFPPLRIEQAYVDRLEAWCDHYNEALPNLRSFILNGGTPGGAHLHVARTVVRRAERAAWAAYEQHGETMSAVAITYLNRLSD
eukprot:gene24271-27456_t